MVDKLPDDNKEIRREVAERVAWAIFRGDQLELGLLIEGHYKNSFLLTFDEREFICEGWKQLEEGRKKTKEESGRGPDED